MQSVLEIGLSNALVATFLALVAWAVTRFVHHPPLVRCLWLVVLLKLITPPIIEVPVVSMLGLQSRPIVGQSAAVVDAPVGGWPGGVEERYPGRLVASNTYPGEVDEVRSRGGWAPEFWCPLTIGGAWAIGSISWFVLAAVRMRRFRRLLRRARPASPLLQAEAKRLAEKFGLRRVPRVRTIDGRIPPLVWAARGREVVLLPLDLLGRLSPARQMTLLAHELAHLVRGDRWTRRLELIVLGLYWWHPVAWHARRALQQAEELCCDGWVLWTYPRMARGYAGALMETIDFLSEARPVLPATASGLGQTPLLKRRFEMILHNGMCRRMSWGTRLLMLLVATAILALSPVAFSAADSDEPEQAVKASVSTAPPKPVPASPPTAAAPAPASADEELRPVRVYDVECKFINRDMKGRRNVLARPTLRMVEGQPGMVFIGSETPLDVGETTTVYLKHGMQMEIRVRGDGEDRVVLYIRVGMSTVPKPNDGKINHAIITRREYETACCVALAERVTFLLGEEPAILLGAEVVIHGPSGQKLTADYVEFVVTKGPPHYETASEAKDRVAHSPWSPIAVKHDRGAPVEGVLPLPPAKPLRR